MDSLAFEEHLRDASRRGGLAHADARGSAGAAACGDVIELALRVEHDRLVAVRTATAGCGAALAAASATAALAEGAHLLEAARIGPEEVERELGGLTSTGRHGAELGADALHAALSALWQGPAAPRLEGTPGRVLVAMSGGVDSAVAALECLERGQQVLAVTLKLWSDPATDGSKACCSPQAVVSARALAHSLGLPHVTLDLRPQFRSAVVEDYLTEHETGRTPNPCVRCNGMVRFTEMGELAERLGAEALVTGHYARVTRDADGPLLEAAADPDKDQAYMLAGLDPALLGRVRFPLGELTKPEVRTRARAAGLPVADRAESQDLCFLAGTGREQFLRRHGEGAGVPGEIVDAGGRVVGRHRGQQHYTVGQRRGLGVAAAEPLYVLRKDAARNRVVVGPRAALARDGVELRPATLYRPGGRVDRVKLRYHAEPLPCSVEGAPVAGPRARLALALELPAQGVAPGQTACLMEGRRVVGYGTIAP